MGMDYKKPYSGADDACIFDFETLGTNTQTAPAVSLAILNIRLSKFTEAEPYTYEGLLEKAVVIKFDVQDQVENYNKKIEKNTLEWWGKLPKHVRKQLIPTENDKSISELHSWLVNNIMLQNLKKIYSRNNTFDPVILTKLMQDTGKDIPYPYWAIRDTKSTIDGLGWGHIKTDSFIPPGLEEKFAAHDPKHDIVMDAMRLQFLVRALEGL